MSPVLVELDAPAPIETAEQEVVFVANMDLVASQEVMVGCGDDNPY